MNGTGKLKWSRKGNIQINDSAEIGKIVLCF